MIQQQSITDLQTVPALQELDLSVLQALSGIARVYHLKPQEVILHQGDVLHSFYVVQRGGVRLVEYTPDGQGVSLKIYGPGDIFGLLAISGSYPHPTQIEAIHDSVVYAVDGQDTRRMIQSCPDFGLLVIDLLTAHVHEAHGRIRQMAAEKVDRRLARALLHLSKKFGRSEGSKISLDVPITQRDLAEFTGTTVETVNRTLTQWCRQGLVACAHKHIDILDYDGLTNIAENQVIAPQS